MLPVMLEIPIFKPETSLFNPHHATSELGTPTTLYLAEAKATAAKSVDDIKRVINSELPRFIPFILAANSLDNSPNKILGLLVGTTVLSSQRFHCSISEVRV